MLGISAVLLAIYILLYSALLSIPLYFVFRFYHKKLLMVIFLIISIVIILFLGSSIIKNGVLLFQIIYASLS